VALETLSRETASFYAPRFEIEIQGTKLKADIGKAILDVSVEEKENEGVSFKMTVHDEFDMEKQEFKWLEHPLFKENNKVTIKVGYGTELSTMIIGKITSIESSFFAGDAPTISIGGQDLAFEKIKTTSKERTYVDKSYSDIAKEIAGEAGLTPEVDGVPKFESVVRKKSDQSYYTFLQDLAKKAGGYKFFVNGNTMFFSKTGEDKKEILTLELKKDIISFRPTFKTTGLLTEVEVRGHDPDNPGTPIVGRATAGSEKAQEPDKKPGSEAVEGERKKVITDVVVRSVEEANALAKAELDKASDTLIEGEGECIGITQLRAGVNIRLEKMGKRFSGKYYVKATTHTINDSGYRTKFSVKRNAA